MKEAHLPLILPQDGSPPPAFDQVSAGLFGADEAELVADMMLRPPLGYPRDQWV